METEKKKQEQFVMLPYEAIKNLSDRELKVFCVLLHYSTMKKGAFPAVKTISEESKKKKSATIEILSSLEAKGLIQRDRRPGTTSIYQIKLPIEENPDVQENTHPEIWTGVNNGNPEIRRTPVRKSGEHPSGNLDTNNIEVNNNEVIENMSDSHNERNFKKWTADDFRKDVERYPEYRVYFEDFISYWTEPDHKGKMRFQLEKTWETKRRLMKWSSNDWNNKPKTEPIYQESKTEKAF